MLCPISFQNTLENKCQITYLIFYLITLFIPPHPYLPGLCRDILCWWWGWCHTWKAWQSLSRTQTCFPGGRSAQSPWKALVQAAESTVPPADTHMCPGSHTCGHQRSGSVDHLRLSTWRDWWVCRLALHPLRCTSLWQSKKPCDMSPCPGSYHTHIGDRKPHQPKSAGLACSSGPDRSSHMF